MAVPGVYFSGNPAGDDGQDLGPKDDIEPVNGSCHLLLQVAAAFRGM